MPLVIPDHCTLSPFFLSVISSQQMPQPTIIVNLGGSVARQVPFPMLYAGWSGTSSWGKSLREMEMTLVCIFLTSFYLFFVMIYIKFTAYREAGN